MKTWQQDPDKSEAELVEAAQLVHNDYKTGLIEDLHFFLLDRQIKENLREIRQDRVSSAFSYLPADTLNEIEKMLEDGKITENEYQTFLDILTHTDGLTPAQKEEIKEQMQRWRVMDKGRETEIKKLGSRDELKEMGK